MASVKVSWSGGKDSTCAVLKHLQAGDDVTAVCYVPMFDHETSLLLLPHYEFILRAADRFRVMGAYVHIVHGITYTEYVTKITTRGKYKGKIMGFPCYVRGMCNFKYYSKLKALASVGGVYDYEDIGIAADEYDRHGQLTSCKRSILYENGITEADALEICMENDLLSPLYALGVRRDGCALCPHAPPSVRRMWFAENPRAIAKVLVLQNLVYNERPDRPPLRGGKWFLEMS